MSKQAQVLSFDAVREMALQLTDVAEAHAYGSPALKINGNLLACVPVNKSAEPNSAAFSIDVGVRATLLASKPEVYYITAHYAAYPIVLVRLSSIGRQELRDLLAMAWSFVAAKKPARASKSRTPKSRTPRLRAPKTAKQAAKRGR